jgi:hypothetical protein
MRNMNKKNLFLIVLFVVTAIYYIPVLNLPLAPYDEAVILVGAERILEGEVPYKDFFSVYPPGQVVTLASLFKVFGTSVIVERVYDLIIKSSLSLLIFLIIRSLSSNIPALIGWLMSLVWLQHSSFPAYPVYPSLLFTYVSIYTFLLYLKQEKDHYLILCAVFIVLSVLFRHDLGGYAAIAITVVLLTRRITGVCSWTPLITYISSGIIAALPATLYFVFNSSTGFMIDDLIIYPATGFPEFQTLPYPSLSRDTLPFFVFPMVLLIGISAASILIKRNKDNAAAYAIFLISLVGIFLFNQVRVRSDYIHLLPVAMTGILLAPVLFDTLLKEISLTVLLERMAYVLFVVVFAITLYKPVMVINRLLSISNGYVLEVLTPEIEKAKYSKIDSDLKRTVLYIENNTPKDEQIYVGVTNHDKLTFNDAIIYFLAGRNSATKYHELNPGHTNTLIIQEEIVSELKDKSVQTLVLAPHAWHEPNISSIDQNIDLLDDFIAANFKLEKTFGIYEIWVRKS